MGARTDQFVRDIMGIEGSITVTNGMAYLPDGSGFDLREFVNEPNEDTKTDADQFIAAAKRIHHRDGECEVDPDAIVSFSDGPGEKGAYVAAWVWVSDKDAGIENEEEEGN